MKGAITFVVILSHQTTPFQEVEFSLGFTGSRRSHQHRLVVTLHPGANVLFELFPQACADCASHGEVRLSPPKWYPEEVDKVTVCRSEPFFFQLSFSFRCSLPKLLSGRFRLIPF